MLKKNIRILAGVCLCLLVFSKAQGEQWECGSDNVTFTHKPSDYYGSGEYFSTCPNPEITIRCYHYHRHWICQKESAYFWDRNLESAARTACGCPLPEGMAPASPSVSKEPQTRFPQ
jgi:hypothetical protein